MAPIATRYLRHEEDDVRYQKNKQLIQDIGGGHTNYNDPISNISRNHFILSPKIGDLSSPKLNQLNLKPQCSPNMPITTPPTTNPPHKLEMPQVDHNHTDQMHWPLKYRQLPTYPQSGPITNNHHFKESIDRISSTDVNEIKSDSDNYGQSLRRKQFLCKKCGKTYKHRNCLIKHNWEHHEHWAGTKRWCQTKHQQVQLLEAAHVLSEITTPLPFRQKIELITLPTSSLNKLSINGGTAQED